MLHIYIEEGYVRIKGSFEKIMYMYSVSQGV